MTIPTPQAFLNRGTQIQQPCIPTRRITSGTHAPGPLFHAQVLDFRLYDRRLAWSGALFEHVAYLDRARWRKTAIYHRRKIIWQNREKPPHVLQPVHEAAKWLETHTPPGPAINPYEPPGLELIVYHRIEILKTLIPTPTSLFDSLSSSFFFLSDPTPVAGDFNRSDYTNITAVIEAYRTGKLNGELGASTVWYGGRCVLGPNEFEDLTTTVGKWRRQYGPGRYWIESLGPPGLRDDAAFTPLSPQPKPLLQPAAPPTPKKQILFNESGFPERRAAARPPSSQQHQPSAAAAPALPKTQILLKKPIPERPPQPRSPSPSSSSLRSEPEPLITSPPRPIITKRPDELDGFVTINSPPPPNALIRSLLPPPYDPRRRPPHTSSDRPHRRLVDTFFRMPVNDNNNNNSGTSSSQRQRLPRNYVLKPDSPPRTELERMKLSSRKAERWSVDSYGSDESF
ncbi:hypothetical protein AJ80_06557 [Polytolypa hystricis UAMH7299]|uniref:Uncharacterized protein n=1 Tax=Polytolypa hystricis (strain UAMH7299) TaxID=1447883 RepID=A0A2B7XWC0_POLH7|nr:hypothetical protein AJ80_06557 [Polytolypa hystricis UAMH7299]